MFRPLKAVGTVLAAWLAFALVSPPGLAAAVPDSGPFEIRFVPRDIYPPANITDLSGTAGAVAGQALLQWTPPIESFGPVTPTGRPVDSFDLRTATFSIVDVGGSTTTWFAGASTITTPMPMPPHFQQAALTSLEVATTYYFAIRSFDDVGLSSDLDTGALGGVTQASVAVKGIQGVTDLTALTGSGSGEIDLTWTAPRIIGSFAPVFYDFRASSTTNILDDAEFVLASPLSAVTDSTAPAGASPGFAHNFTITGLTPAVTYYFAVRETDSGVPYFGAWRSSAALDINAFNSARASFSPQPPERITNLTAVPGTFAGSIGLTWTAPENLNGVPIERYEVRINTNSIFDVGSSTTSWYALLGSTEVVLVDGSLPGADVTTEIGGLNASLQYFFGIKAVDITGQKSEVDTGALTVAQQVRAFPRPAPPIINLTATSGLASGSIDLEWTVPSSQGLVDPRGYEFRASTLTNINNDIAFAFAKPLSSFTGTASPTAGAPSSIQNLTLTGLNPRTTYYFAMRITDSNTPPVQSAWFRDLGQDINVNNFAVATFVSNPPQAITDLTALAGSDRGEVDLSWTAPLNQNFVAISSYVVYGATTSVSAFFGDVAAWETTASTRVYYPAALPGATETFTFTGLLPGDAHYFAIRSIDESGDVSPTDTETQGAFNQIQAAPQGVGDVRDLNAQGGTPAGSIDLSWTTPRTQSVTAPFSYDIRASSTTSLNDDAALVAAQPLSAFSGTEIPNYTIPGAGTALRVTGLNPLTTYYFAIRVVDSSATANVGAWGRNVGLGVNTTNFSIPTFIARPPIPISDLTALVGISEGRIDLAWTAPLNPNFVPVSSYTVAFASFPISDLAGDTTAWFNAASSQVVVSPAQAPGALETLALTGLEPGVEYFFGVRSIDAANYVSAIDDRTATDKLNDPVLVRAYGVQRVTDLIAVTGTESGDIALSWTAPHRSGVLDPSAYVIKVSSVANIENAADFVAAELLTHLTQSPIPTLASGGSAESMIVTGLAPFTTYYFALRVEDSSTPVVNAGVWQRHPSLGDNATNFAPARFIPHAPDPITDLTALTGGLTGRIDLSWTAPRNTNLIGIASYTVAFASFSVAELGNDATAWFTLASSQVVVAPAQAPGALETLSIAGFEPGLEYFFGIQSIDHLDEVSPIDDRAAPDKLADQARARSYGIQRTTDLVAVTSAGSGEIDLSWTAPHRAGIADPTSYLIRVSSVANIVDPAAFNAAQPLSAFTGTPTPSVGIGGSAESLNVTGLLPFTTYYFAMRVEDSSTPVKNISVWERSTDFAFNLGNFAAGSFFSHPPEPITDLTALQGTTEGHIQLEWTAPFNKNFIPITSYEVRFASFSVNAAPFLGNTTAWFDALVSSEVILSPAKAPGGLETLLLTGIHPSNTMYFTVRAIDAIGEIGVFDTNTLSLVQASTQPFNVAPATPGAPTTQDDTLAVNIGWPELSNVLPEQGLNFDVYRLERSTDNVQFVSITTGPAAFYRDIPLRAYTTYYYRVTAIDEAGLESAPSPVTSALPFTLLPMEPFGIYFERDGSSITMSWAPTVNFNDESSFINDPLTTDELSGYRVDRSTTECTDFSTIATLPVGTTKYSEIDTGNAYFYRITSFNQYFQSTSPIVLASLGNQIAFTGDCVSRVDLPEDMQDLLLDPSGDPAKHIRIKRETVYSENKGKVVNTVTFLPMRGGTDLVENFTLPRPVEIKLRYDATPQGAPIAVQGLSVAGAPANQTKGMATSANGGYAPASIGGKALAGNLTPAAAGAEKHLGVFWNNGEKYVKQYGKVNTTDQTIAVNTPNLGSFQVRTHFREAGVTFDVSNITTRVITPNNDGRNDVTIMLFDNPNGTTVEGVIYDLRGAKVANMTNGPQPNTLMWDGKMNGAVVTSGVYVYQVKAEGKTYNGTFVVAR